ncbi:type II toxin-antitoxin system HicA family toxin [Aminithiophilus ramosus]|uniref:Type II toxin-antitoxin system HicA family toxin n=2 Tax=Synergistales TaxID=649776 RepID=A0A9Q7AFV9_9BACT|nr:type II toxin-antitoxin system HicA family toxin [Aminithiophilus ramosus]QTX31370.1 type II toxin-antitoxin system HicA family toxin [Aminithiophilus ramosus]QVL35169.1 type II toxin-antitoxin system HicA family toxin [Synergistota bacterium]
MSPTLPRLTGAEMIAFLKRCGFRRTRQRGSHVVMENDDGRVTVVPLHEGKTLGTGILKTILKSAGIAEDELRR